MVMNLKIATKTKTTTKGPVKCMAPKSSCSGPKGVIFQNVNLKHRRADCTAPLPDTQWSRLSPWLGSPRERVEGRQSDPCRNYKWGSNQTQPPPPLSPSIVAGRGEGGGGCGGWGAIQFQYQSFTRFHEGHVDNDSTLNLIKPRLQTDMASNHITVSFISAAW